jgi:hypothetical protein
VSFRDDPRSQDVHNVMPPKVKRMKRRATDEDIHAFIAAVYPLGPALATAAFDEATVLREATRLITELRTKNAELSALPCTREELDELRAWRINVTSALRREGGALYADVPEHIRELRRKMDRVTMLCQAVRVVLEGFDKNIFVRDVTGDTDTWWAVRVLPYVSALATMKNLVEI